MNQKPIRIEFTQRFSKQRKAAQVEIKIAFLESLELFLDDPNHSQLRNHPLKGQYSGYNSINITSDWRALLKIRTNKGQITLVFHMLGTHMQLYG